MKTYIRRKQHKKSTPKHNKTNRTETKVSIGTTDNIKYRTGGGGRGGLIDCTLTALTLP